MRPSRKRDRFLPCILWTRGKRFEGSPESAPRLPAERPIETERAQADDAILGIVAQQDSSGPWKAVINDIGKDDRRRLRDYGITTDDDDLQALDVNDAWTQLLQVVEQKQKDVVDKSWKIHFRGNTVVLRDVIGSIASRLQSLKDIGDAVAGLLPAQAALPWAIMTFLIKEMMKGEEQRQILQWASQIGYLEDHQIAKKGITDNTGTWLLQNDSFKGWKDSQESQIFWLYGIPGSGKSKLSTRVVDALSSDTKKGCGLVATAYFYCDRNRKDHQDPGQIVASLVRQLSFREDSQAVVGFISDHYRQHQAKGFAAALTPRECIDLLTRLISMYRKVFLVVDGLEECDKTTRRAFMDTLESIRLGSTSTVKIFIASRDDGDIKTRYNAISNLVVSVADNQDDIERFVVAQIETSSWNDNPNMESVRDEVIGTFRTKSQGMFLWASLHIRELLELQRPRDVRDYLQKLPEGLRKTYHEIYAKILSKRGSEGEIATRAFQWLMCSARPLAPEELVVLVCQDPDTDFSFDIDITVGFLLEACQNLIVVTEPVVPKDTYLRYFKESMGIAAQSFCRFAHLSVHEYFEQEQWNSPRCHVMAAGICLRAMLTPSLVELRERWRAVSERLPFDIEIYISTYYDRKKIGRERCMLLKTESSLLYYVEDWHFHVRSCGRLYHEVSGLLRRFLGKPHDNNEAAKSWLITTKHYASVVSRNESGDYALYEPVHFRILDPDNTSLLLCVAYGLVELVREWIQDGQVDVNFVTEKGIPLLSIAAYTQQYDMVKLLLEHGADPNVQIVCEDQLEDLCLVPRQGQLESFSPIDAAARSHGNCEKRLAMTALLIDHGAQACHSLKGLEYAVHWSRRDYDTTELLLRHGAGSNELSDGHYWAHSYVQSYVSGYNETQRYWNLLLDYGAKTHEVILGSGPLSGCFRLPIAKGAITASQWRRWLENNPTPISFQSFCSLTRALADYWHEEDAETMSILIQNGAHPSSALGMLDYISDESRRKRRDRILIEWFGAEVNFCSLGADVNAISPVYGTPLHMAFDPRFGPYDKTNASMGTPWPKEAPDINKGVALLLLRNGARVDIRGGRDEATVAELAQRVQDVEFKDLVNMVLVRAGLPERSDFPVADWVNKEVVFRMDDRKIMEEE
ncbi:hypothetical protein PG984_013822 [Apiospora sp. TS-2023a]